MAKMTKLGICAQSSGVKGRSKERLAIFVSMEKSTWDNGHTESIISLDVNNDGIVVSGGEDGLRIWTPEGEPQTFLKHPCDVTSVCFCCQYPERLFASVGQQPLMYDLRNPQKPVHEFQPSAEEINQIALHYKGKFMAACDDTGVVKVFDIHAKKPFKTLRGKHESICASVQFRPCRPWELVTGGMDYRVVYWDFSSGRSFQVANTQELGGGDELGAYFVNPPFVHSVHMSADGRKFACGLGNGTIQLFCFQGKKKFITNEQIRAHSQGVSQVHFPKFDPNGTLASGGNDSRLMLWNLSSEQVNGHQSTAGHSSCSVIHEINHGSKVNYITSSSLSKKRLFVADQSNNISVYEIQQ